MQLVLSVFLDLLFPKKCVSCGKFGAYLCKACSEKIEPGRFPICPMCERQAVDGVTHPGCRTRYSLDGLVAPFRYDDAIKAAIKRLKYKPYIAELGEILIDHIFNNKTIQQFNNNFIVVAVPLYPQRERERGFNQAALIGKAIAKRLEMEFADGVLKRTRNTKPQVELKGDDRRKNVTDAFAISSNFSISQFPNILLIDDVWTTGSTLRTCANILKRAGVKKVWAFTVAR